VYLHYAEFKQTFLNSSVNVLPGLRVLPTFCYFLGKASNQISSNVNAVAELHITMESKRYGGKKPKRRHIAEITMPMLSEKLADPVA
jgi:hypothetical protein